MTPPIFDQEAMDDYTWYVKRAIVKVFHILSEGFKEFNPSSVAGCTMTLVLQYGWHFFIANVGEIKCVVDTSSGFAQVTTLHKLGVNVQET